MDLIKLLEQKLAETEELATDAAEQVGDGNWQQRGARIVTVVDRDREVADYAIVECIWHIVHNDPKRILDKVAADRELLAGHADVHRCDFGEYRGGEFGPCGLVVNRAKAYGIDTSGSAEIAAIIEQEGLPY